MMDWAMPMLVLFTEVLPQVEQRNLNDGRAIHLSKTGTIVLLAVQAVVLFARLLQHGSAPKHFQEHLAIGTYIGLRGADRYPILIRKYEPKPIRVFTGRQQ